MSCEKGTYPTRRAAIRVALSASRKRGTPLRVYGCVTCHGFHLTKTPARWNRQTGGTDRDR